MEFQHLEMMLFPMGMREASAKKRGSIPSAVADQRKYYIVIEEHIITPIFP